MSQEDLSHYIPTRLDDKGKFLFWDLDVSAIALMGMLLGLAVEYPLLGCIAGIACAVFYSRLKSGKHPGMAAHLIYWHLGIPEPRVLPKSHIRQMIG